MRRQKSILRVFLEPLAIAIVLACAVRAMVRLYSVPSTSMLPTLQVGDHILVTPYRGSAPARGDIVVFRAPGSPSEVRVKRVIALPGDLIDSAGDRVRIGGHTLAETYVLRKATGAPIAPQIVPADFVFVMGDNREDSVDSRQWGPLPRELVLGRVRMVLWSSCSGGARASTATAAGRCRLGRIFKWVE